MVDKRLQPNVPPQTLDLRAIPHAPKKETTKLWQKLAAQIRLSKRAVLIGASCLVAALAISAVFEITLNIARHHPFSSHIVTAANFPLYYPSKLPSDYTFNNTGASYANSVLIFTVTAPGGKTVNVSEEATPPGYDFSQIQGSDTFRTSVGQATINYNQSFTSASVVGSMTWILIRATNPVTTNDLVTLVSNFAPITK